MKKINRKWLAAGSLLAAAITFCAWREGAPGFQNRNTPYITAEDTIPAKKHTYRNEFRSGDLDHALQDIDRAMEQFNKKINIDMGGMEKHIREAMEQVKKVDYDKINRQVTAALKQIDWEKTNRQVQDAMKIAETELKKVDMEEVRKNVQKAMENVNTEKILQQIDFENIRKNVEKGMEHARTGLEKAKKELTLLKEFTSELEKDGLVDKKKGYTIEIKSGEMYINGVKQSKEVNDKYRRYFKDEDYTIKSDAEGAVRI
jgi:hypothetical protein